MQAGKQIPRVKWERRHSYCCKTQPQSVTAVKLSKAVQPAERLFPRACLRISVLVGERSSHSRAARALKGAADVYAALCHLLACIPRDSAIHVAHFFEGGKAPRLLDLVALNIFSE